MLEGKNNPEETDPEKLARLLELELMQKRAGWQKAKARRSGLRAMSFLFLFLIFGAALTAFFLFFNPDRVREIRSDQNSLVSPSPAASPR
jgi:hypothetical protein